MASNNNAKPTAAKAGKNLFGFFKKTEVVQESKVQLTKGFRQDVSGQKLNPSFDHYNQVITGSFAYAEAQIEAARKLFIATQQADVSTHRGPSFGAGK